MDLTHRFTVPVPVDAAWAHFNDIASVAECFPGATVTSVEDDTFHGSVKVKLGPIALVYNGSGTFTEKDESTHRMVVDAKGKDKRGNGTAGALVTMTMQESAADGGGSTDVEVVTDLAITGKPAQFGRGVMQDVSDKLLGQFVACLEQRLGEDESSSAPAPVEPASAVPVEAVEPAGPRPGESVETPPVPPREVSTSPTGGSPPSAPATAPRPSDDALDLGSTVLPILAKSYWKQALAGAVVIAVVIWLIGRR